MKVTEEEVTDMKATEEEETDMKVTVAVGGVEVMSLPWKQEID